MGEYISKIPVFRDSCLLQAGSESRERVIVTLVDASSVTHFYLNSNLIKY